MFEQLKNLIKNFDFKQLKNLIKNFIKNFDLKHSKWLTVEFFRTLPLVVLATFMFWPDFSTLKVVQYVFGFLFVIALISHTIRKVLFPYIDLREYARKALETPVSASLVFVGFCAILCTLMIVGADFFH